MKRLAVLLVVAGALLQWVPSARAQTASSAPSQVDPFFGSFGTSVPIAVPKFHGVEPSLNLTYSSAAGNGWFGVGWTLSAFSMIERASPGKGSPGYGTTDIFLLDGQTLIPCVSGSASPSCTTGGTHSAEIENYQRIVFQSNTWTITAKDGTVTTYSPIKNVPAGTFRWGVTRVSDTKGNAVTYRWWCDSSSSDCYPDSIGYSNITVTLYREARPDAITFATGSNIGQTNYRIKTVDVVVGTARARAYKLTYTTSSNTTRSLLTGVQQFGTDANLDATGSITSGTSLPGLSTQYQSAPGGLATPQNWNSYGPLGYVNDAMPRWGGAAGDYTQLIDMNGDGRNDYVAHYNYSTSQYGMWVSLNTGSGFGPPQNWNSAGLLGNVNYGQPRWANGTDFSQLVDMNADGRPDYVAFYNYTNGQYGLWVLLNTGSGFAAPQNWNSYGLLGNAGNSYPRWSNGSDLTSLVDMDGDGRPDYVSYYNYQTGGGYGLWVLLNTGTGFAAPQNWNSYGLLGTAGNSYPRWSNGSDLTSLIDMNGDGRPDYVSYYNYQAGGGYGLWVLLNTGSGFAAPQNWNSYGLLGNAGNSYPRWSNGSDLTSLIDMNGDGRPDFVSYYNYQVGGGYGLWVLLNTGSGFAAPQNWNSCGLLGTAADSYPRWSNGSDFTSLIDMNGDGRPDFVTFYNYLTAQYGLWVLVNTGTGFAAPQNWNSYGLLGNVGDSYPRWGGAGGDYSKLIDMDGDGLPDYVTYYNNNGGGYGLWVSTSSGHAPDLLSSVSNGLGGTTSVSYTPSTAWSNTYLPPHMVLQTASSLTTTDGRGGSSTTSYSYQGGLWWPAGRRFLGFRKVTGVIDAAGDYVETYYHQGVGCISKPDATYLKDATGNIFSYSSYAYTESGTAPYTSLLTSRWDYECNQTTTCRRVLMQVAYDAYANPTTVSEYGDYDVSGDERTTVRGFQPNTSAYVVLLPAYENIYTGIGTIGPLVKQTLYRYDGASSYTSPPTKGLLTAKDRWKSQTGTFATATFNNDAYGNRTTETDEDGRATTHTYDATYNAFETQRCNALSQCVSYAWDTTLGVKSSETDGNGTTTITHDPLGRATQIASSGGMTTTYSYLSWGDPTQQRTRTSVADGSADGLWSDQYLDGIGRPWRTVKKGGFTEDTLYSDASSRKWKQSIPYLAGDTVRYEVFAYDGAGRIRTVTHPDGNQAQRVYGNGTETQLDELGNEHTFWKDGLGNVIQIREKNGTAYYTTTKQFDVLGNMVQETDANGYVSKNTFDSLSRRTGSVDPDFGAHTYQYSAAGLLVGVTDAANRTVTFQYDAAARRVEKTYPDESTIQWSYDEAGHGASVGRLTSVTVATHSESFTYAVDGQVTKETDCVQSTCETFNRAYDAVGRLASVTYPDNEVVGNTYDASGRLTAVQGYVTTIAYDSAGAITSVVYPNGTTTSYGYDLNRRWLTSAQVTSGAGTLYQAAYAYDAAARVTSTTSTTNPSMNLTYGYDSLNRLTTISGSQSETIAYDALGNITSAARGAYGYGDPKHVHAATSVGSATYAYDVKGNMLSGGGRTLTWDDDNRLLSTTVSGAATTYLYDADGQRIAKQSGGTSTLYFGKLADTVNGALEKYYYAGGVLVAKQSAGVKSWYHADHLGSIRLMTSATGAKANGYDYSAWGATLASSGSVPNELGFGGHHADGASGLVYMSARYYDPQLHRFISADSVVPSETNPQALNRYSFAYDNPINNTDPTGHAPVAAALIAVAAYPAFPTWFALAVTVLGYASHDATLMTIGSVVDGFVGGPIGGFVAAATSPLSPIDPRIKRDIGWAYSAYGLIKAYDMAQAKAAEKASTPGNASAPNGASGDQTTPDGSNVKPAGQWDPLHLTRSDGYLHNVWAIFTHNAEKLQAVGAEDDTTWWKGEGSFGMSVVSGDSSFHIYGVLHDTLIDTIRLVTKAPMDLNFRTPGGLFNFGSNAVLIGAGLRLGWFGRPDYMDSAMRSAQYRRNDIAIGQ